MKLSEAKSNLRSILETLETGCSNHGCAVAKRPRGSLGTNATCRCNPQGISKDLVRLAGWMGAELAWGPEDETGGFMSHTSTPYPDCGRSLIPLIREKDLHWRINTGHGEWFDPSEEGIATPEDALNDGYFIGISKITTP